MKPNSARYLSPVAFTLVELLVSMAIFSILAVIFVKIIDQTSLTWKRTTAKVEQFREARAGFEAITTTLAQATLNTYWDYNSPTAPTRYERRSELRFLSNKTASILATGDHPTHGVFFQAPLGATVSYRGFENLLGTVGYYLEYGSDATFRPDFITSAMTPFRMRHRLMEVREIAEKPGIYKYSSGAPAYNATTWITDAINGGYARPIAENIIALVITPRLSKADEAARPSGAPGDLSPLAPVYAYDSTSSNADASINPKNQLPPVIQVTMVAVDEASVVRLGANYQTIVNTAGKFEKSEDFSKDLFARDPITGTANPASLETVLVANRVNYRIFTSNVAIPGAKWSRTQAN